MINKIKLNNMKRKRIIWHTTFVIMIIVYISAFLIMMSVGLMDMQSDIILNVSTGIIALPAVIMLLFAYSIDYSISDDSSALIYILLVITYAGIMTDNFSWFAEGNIKFVWISYIFCPVSYLMTAVVAPLLMICQRTVLNINKNTKLVRLVKIFMVADIIYLITAIKSGFLYTINSEGCFITGTGHYFSAIYPLFVFAIGFADNIRSNAKINKRLPMMLCTSVLFVAGVISIFYESLSLFYIALMFNLMMMYFVIQMEHSVERAEQAKKIAEQSKDLSEKQMQIMMSQIQPHFIYNTLGSISSLCEENPIMARDVTDKFAMYLRVNMANLKKDRLIPFNDEWEHTKTYLWIEKIRFENYLNVVSDIKCTDFRLPPLSLQPIVENAVKHGITPKPEGGTVKISAYENSHCYIVTISDDGAGFDVNMPANDGKLHVGIENVRNRLEMLCNGKLNIESRIGVGTKAEIIIPKENFSDDLLTCR